MEPALAKHLALMRQGPIAVAPSVANDQHYETLVDFFRLVLGPRLKYSAGREWFVAHYLLRHGRSTGPTASPPAG